MSIGFPTVDPNWHIMHNKTPTQDSYITLPSKMEGFTFIQCGKSLFPHAINYKPKDFFSDSLNMVVNKVNICHFFIYDNWGLFNS